jgi:hypothetical protein
VHDGVDGQRRGADLCGDGDVGVTATESDLVPQNNAKSGVLVIAP